MKDFTINDTNINQGFGLITSPGYSIGMPEVKTNIQELPGADGDLDLTEVLNGDVFYKSREFVAKFTFKGDRLDWQDNLTRLRSQIHGRRCSMFEPDEVDYYYEGRFYVGPLLFERPFAHVEITATLEPYKFKKDLTIKEYTLGTGSLTIDIPNGRKSVIPTITVDNTTQIIFKDKAITISAGTYKNSNVIFRQGDNEITINAEIGTTVKFEYREGEL